MVVHVFFQDVDDRAGMSIRAVGVEAGAVVDILEEHMHDHHPGTELVTYRTGHRYSTPISSTSP
ncbi:hypothetical protein MAHJHV60_45990 [Mycobacterium avium subsp. hominissuis]